MAAAGAALKQGSWIARKWREGWEKIPVVMAAHCLTTPFLIFFVGNRILYGRPELEAVKYRARLTVIRPDDPRVKRISNYSPYDKVGVFS